MSDYEMEQSPSDDVVELLLESQAGKELYGAVRLALGFAAVSEGSAGANRNSIDAMGITVNFAPK